MDSLKVALFNRNVRKEFDVMMVNQVVQLGTPHSAGRCGQTYFSPIGVVLKNSDIMELARISVKDQHSLNRANLILHDIFLKVMKILLTANGNISSNNSNSNGNNNRQIMEG